MNPNRGGTMASMWRKAMHYLGLGPDDEYEDDTDAGYGATTAGRGPAAGGYGAPATRGPAASGSSVTRVTPSPSNDRPLPPPPPPPPPPSGTGAVATTPEVSGVRPVPASPFGAETGSGSVRPIPASARVTEITPVAFNDAQAVGDRFRSSNAVAMDLGSVDRDLARRLIDFCSGLCYGQGGKMERIAGQVYLITPAGAEVSAEERRRLAGDD
jgi:cell division inhibitor SepF